MLQGTHVDELQQALVDLRLLLAQQHLLVCRRLLFICVLIQVHGGQVTHQGHGIGHRPHTLREDELATQAHLRQLGFVGATEDHRQAHRHRLQHREWLRRHGHGAAVLWSNIHVHIGT